MFLDIKRLYWWECPFLGLFMAINGRFKRMMENMNYKILLLLMTFLLGLELSAASRPVTKGGYVALKNKVACAANEKEAILKVDEILKKVTGISSKHLYSKNIYIRHKKNSKGMSCVEGVITQKGFERYIAELEDEYEFIMGQVEDLNDGVGYEQKEAEVDHVYREVKLFNKKLEIANKLAAVPIKKIDNNRAAISKKINAIPVVKFHVRGCKGKYITGCKLVFVSSFKDDSTTVNYRWDFGDGSTSKRKNPIHSYTRPGMYSVTLRITDAGKKHKEVTKKLRIKAKPKPRVKHKPVAGFKTDHDVYETDEMISFVNSSTSEKSKITKYNWDFGNKQHSTQREPKQSYHKSGHYKVRLEIENSDNLKSSVEKSLFIVHPAIKYGIDGRKYNRIVRKFGQPSKSVVKPGVLTHAYQYGNDWLLVKQNKVICRVKGSAFKTNLMGNPKNCRWYEKHAPTALYSFE